MRSFFAGVVSLQVLFKQMNVSVRVPCLCRILLSVKL